MKRIATLLAAGVLASATSLAFAQDIKIAHVYDKTGPLEAYAKQTSIGFMLGLEYATGGKMERDRPQDRGDREGRPEQARRRQGAARRGLRRRQGRHRGRPGQFRRRRWRCCRWPRNTRRCCWSSRRWPTRSPATSGTATSSAPRAIRRRTRSPARSTLTARTCTIATLAQDYAFGRDGVKAFKEALAAAGSKAKIVHEEYAPPATTDFTAPAQRMFDALKDKPGTQDARDHLGRRASDGKLADMKPERYGIELAPGGNILPVMKTWKDSPASRARSTTTTTFPKNPMNDWLVDGAQEALRGAPPDFFTAGGMAAAIAVVEAIKKAGGTDTEKLIAAMEGMSFDTPKGIDDLPQGRPPGAADHVPLPHQESADERVGPARAGARDSGQRDVRCRSATSADRGTRRPGDARADDRGHHRAHTRPRNPRTDASASAATSRSTAVSLRVSIRARSPRSSGRTARARPPTST